MRRFLLISLVPLVVACSSPTVAPSVPAPAGPASAASAPKTVAQPASGNPEPKQAAQAPSQAAPKTEQRPAVESNPRTQAKPAEAAVPSGPKATIAPPAENHGIALGQPIEVGANLAGLLVTNTTDRVMTFDIKIAYREGDAVGEMTGTVSDLLPKQSRVAQANAYKLIPSNPDAVSVSVTGVKTAAPSTPKGDIAKNITVTEPKKVENSSSVTVEVTNNGTRTQNVALVSAYMQGDELVAYGEGSTAGLKSGETRTVTLRPISPMKTHDRVDVDVKSV